MGRLLKKDKVMKGVLSAVMLLAFMLPVMAATILPVGLSDDNRFIGFSEWVKVIRWEVPDEEPMYAADLGEGRVSFFRAGDAQCMDKMMNPVSCPYGEGKTPPESVDYAPPPVSVSYPYTPHTKPPVRVSSGPPAHIPFIPWIPCCGYNPPSDPGDPPHTPDDPDDPDNPPSVVPAPPAMLLLFTVIAAFGITRKIMVKK